MHAADERSNLNSPDTSEQLTKPEKLPPPVCVPGEPCPYITRREEVREPVMLTPVGPERRDGNFDSVALPGAIDISGDVGGFCARFLEHPPQRRYRNLLQAPEPYRRNLAPPCCFVGRRPSTGRAPGQSPARDSSRAFPWEPADGRKSLYISHIIGIMSNDALPCGGDWRYKPHGQPLEDYL
jgi:hypothetical protein